MVCIDQITKQFRGRVALHPLSLEIERSEIFGLLGHNGAGKSTTFGIMLGQVYPDRGDVFFGKESISNARERALRRVGAIFEAPAFYDYLSGLSNLKIFSAYTGPVTNSKLGEVIELVGLTERIVDPVRTYSHGMRQRLALAQALLPDPEFILLDEPSEGLDPEGIREMRELILRLRSEKGLTVMLSSHLLAEVEQICDRIAILNQGRMIYCGAWKETLQLRPRFRLEVTDPVTAAPILQRFGDWMEGVLTCDGDIADVVEALVRGGIRVHAVEPLKVSLEDFYLDRIGQ